MQGTVRCVIRNSWSSWPTFGQRAASERQACVWPARPLFWYVREQDICERSNRGIAFLPGNPSVRVSYIVWFVIRGHRGQPSASERQASGKRVCVWPARTLLWYVCDQDICERSNRGIAFLPGNPSFRAPYAVWFVVIVVNLRASTGKRIYVWLTTTLLWCVREHDICERSTRGIAFLARNP